MECVCLGNRYLALFYMNGMYKTDSKKGGTSVNCHFATLSPLLEYLLALGKVIRGQMGNSTSGFVLFSHYFPMG